ncbi:MAG: FHA domain-containing protein [Chloroflexota bacterium]
MTHSVEAERQRVGHCPQCNRVTHPGDNYCASCGYPLVPPTAQLPKTGPLTREPAAFPSTNGRTDRFTVRDSAVLQFLPSGVCVSLPLRQPTLLGRGQTPDGTLYDLTPFNALPHGVSRHHCLLRRDGERLLITDLDTLNGTYVNGQRLAPRRDYVLQHGDRLILGSLHIIVSFHR